MSNDNVIDFATKKAIPGAGAPAKKDPFAEDPWLTVGFYESPHLRIKGKTDLDATALREAAKAMISAAIGLLNSAWTMDMNDEELPRMMVQLFHTGKMEINTFNGKIDGNPSQEEFDWLMRSLPHARNLLLDMKGRANE